MTDTEKQDPNDGAETVTETEINTVTEEETTSTTVEPADETGSAAPNADEED